MDEFRLELIIIADIKSDVLQPITTSSGEKAAFFPDILYNDFKREVTVTDNTANFPQSRTFQLFLDLE